LRVDLGRITTLAFDRRPHGREVDDRRDPREVLEQNACRSERELAILQWFLPPRGEKRDLFFGRVDRLGQAQQVLE
jgi:hypothetical protein